MICDILPIFLNVVSAANHGHCADRADHEVVRLWQLAWCHLYSTIIVDSARWIDLSFSIITSRNIQQSNVSVTEEAANTSIFLAKN